MSLFKKIGKFIDDEQVREIRDGFANTGCIPINLLLSGKVDGGIPRRGVTTLAGDSGYGKTYIALSAAKNFMDDGYSVLWIDSEFAINEDTIKNFGLQKRIDSEQLKIIGETNINKIKSLLVNILEEIDRDDKLVIVIDSYSALVTTKSVEDALKEKEVADMHTVKKKNEMMTIVNGLAAKKEVPVIVINHVYQEQSAMYPKTIISGGTKVRYFSNSILLLNSKAKVKDKNGNVIGAMVTAITDKSRFAKEQTRMKFYINFTKGLSKYHGLLDSFIDMGLIVKEGKRVYSIENPDKKWWEKDIYCDEFFEPLLEKHRDKIEENFKYKPIKEDFDIVEESYE